MRHVGQWHNLHESLCKCESNAPPSPLNGSRQALTAQHNCETRQQRTMETMEPFSRGMMAVCASCETLGDAARHGNVCHLAPEAVRQLALGAGGVGGRDLLGVVLLAAPG